ncbi:meiotic recombination [Apiospora marii]|uniref:Double-strand break repair protein n=1 Tax=Apiospora marii TaxID=335849 RepID=A0ABR1R368_9PEZI
MAASELTEADTIRILVATDNHVGYGERDPIRKDDSWKSFDEILQLARKQDVDMVLLAGDLFHENKPSRPAMFQVMRSLRKNCLGMKPVQLQFLSDAVDVFHGAFSYVNYEDPDINISIPVFSIHGNHDDPSGDGNYCSLDLLQVSGLVNYFGRVPEVDNISVKPVLLQKGSTKLALYGLSNVRDERMYRTFRDHHVKWFRPNVQTSDWFNLLAVHQNHHAHTATSYLPENALPEWLDLVVWGHEHECLIDPTLNPETGFHVMQPGSSVATSLVPGEAVAKHVAILNVTGKEFKVEKHRIKSVRPFVTREIVLAKDDRFKALAKRKDNRSEITRKLMEVVEEMIAEANDDWASIQDRNEDQEEGEDEERDEAPLPLIRLKVEYTPPEGGQFDCENPQRFSNRFAGKVANTHDVVYFYKKKTIQRKEKIEEISEETLAELGLNAIEVDRLVAEYFEKQTLKILPQAPFNDAVTQFVSKDDKHVMEQFVDDQLTTQVKQMMSLNDDNDDDEEILNIMRKIKAREEKQFKAGELKTRRRIVKSKPDGWDSDLEGHWEDQEGVITIIDDQGDKPQTAKAQGRAKGRNQDDDDDLDMDLDDEVVEDTAPKKKGRPAKKPAAKAAPSKAAAKKAPAKGRGRKTGPFVDEDDDEDDDVIMDDDDDEPPAPPPKRGAAAKSQPARSQPTRSRPARAAAATTSKRQTQLNFSSQKGSQANALEISDDEISDDDDDPFETMPTKKSTRKR